MKWMNWSWHDLMSAPAEIVDEIIRMMQEQIEEQEMAALIASSKG